MTVTAKLADGRELNFPDGTDPAVVQATVKKILGQQQAQQPVQQVQPEQQIGIGDQAIGVLENLRSLVGTGVLEATGIPGLAGLVAEAVPGGRTGAEQVEAIRSGVRELLAPETPAGVAQEQALGRAAQTVEQEVIRPAVAGTAGLARLALRPSEGLEGARQTVQAVREQGLGQAAGQQVLGATDSPVLASLAATVPTAASIFAGGAIAKAPGITKPKTPFKESLANKIQSGTTDKNFVDKMVDGAGRVRVDNVATEAIKQGFDEGVVAAIKGSSTLDKAKMLNMVRRLERGKRDAKFAAKNRPADIAGDSLLERVKHVKTVNKDAGKQLNNIAKGLRGQQVDLTQEVRAFFDDLREMGVSVNENLAPNFSGSVIDDIAPAKRLISNLTRRIRQNPNADAFDAHTFKKIIDEQVTFGKSAKGLGGQAERVAKKLRANIDSKLDNTFPVYNEVNTRFADSVKAIDALQDAAGKKLNLFGPNADKATGTLLRRLTSNAQGRVLLMDAIDELETVGRRYGGNFSDDILSQMMFADELDAMFGTVARTSLAGETKKAIQAARGGLSERLIDAAGELAEKARGINEANAIKSMKELLQRDQ